MISFIKKKIQKKALQGQFAIICGGSKGIGKETAKLFVKLGADVLIIARGLPALQEVKSECLNLAKSSDQKIRIESCDCSNFDLLKPIIEKHIHDLGTPNFLINVVGYAYPQYIEKLTISDFKKNLDSNYYGQLVPTLIVLPFMMHDKQGHIAFVSSTAGFLGVMGYCTYSPTKFAIVGLAEALRNELHPYKIKISVVYPPDTNTPGFVEENKIKPPETALMSESAKLLSPEEVASIFISGILKKKFTIMHGDVRLFSWIKRFFPNLGFWIMDLLLMNARKKLGKD